MKSTGYLFTSPEQQICDLVVRENRASSHVEYKREMPANIRGRSQVYVVTNREVLENQSGLDQFGRKPNNQGPNELRLADVRRHGAGWRVKFLDDELDQDEAKALIDKFSLALDPDAQHYASLQVACDVAERAVDNKSHILFFVHGYNNNMHDVMARAHDLAERYKVEVIPFSWPANGGGLGGTADYRSDKRDARASAGALERALGKMHVYLRLITDSLRDKFFAEAEKKHPDNPEARNALYAKLLDSKCPFTVNALFHSMGNYVLKHMLKSSIAEGTGLIFDNVVLAAADTNNLDHDLWVNRIRFRKRCFIAINEDDFALRASRAKAGSEQLARLGHYLRNLTAVSAHYVNFTDASWVRNSHSYFGEPAEKNEKVFTFFKRAFTGEAAEEQLRFHAEGNWYGL